MDKEILENIQGLIHEAQYSDDKIHSRYAQKLIEETRASWEEIAELKAENERLNKWFNSSKEVYLENADLLVDNAILKARVDELKEYKFMYEGLCK